MNHHAFLRNPNLAIRIDPEDLAVLDNVEYRRVQDNKRGHLATLDRGYLLSPVAHPGQVETVTQEQLRAFMDRGALQIHRRYFAVGQAEARRYHSSEYLTDLKPAAQMRHAFKIDCVNALKAAVANGTTKLSDDSLQTFGETWYPQYVVDRALQETPDGRHGKDFSVKRCPAPSTMRRWLREFNRCDGDPASLIDNYGKSGNRKVALPKRSHEIMEEHVGKYLSPERPSQKSLYSDMEKQCLQEGVRCPSSSSFRRAIKRLDPFIVMAKREGEEKARKHYHFVQSIRPATRPLERVEMDECLIPLISLGQMLDEPDKATLRATKNLSEAARSFLQRCRHRLWLISAIDTYSNAALAARLTENPSAEASVATLRMAINDKTWLSDLLGCESAWDMFGTPELIVTDSGSSWRSTRFRNVVLDLGCKIMIAPAGHPELRGKNERNYGTLHTALFSHFPGRTFHNSVAKGDYDAEANAVVLDDELAAEIVRFFVDRYNNTPQAVLAGATPRQVWDEGVRRHGICPPPSKKVQQHLFAVPLEDRTVDNRGIPVLGNYYQSRELQAARLKGGESQIDIRVDPDNLGAISASTPEGWISVPCTDPDFEGVDVRSFMETVRRVKERNGAAAALVADTVRKSLDQTKAFIKECIDRAELVRPVVSAEDIERMEKDLFATFDYDQHRGEEDMLVFTDESASSSDLPDISGASGEENEDDEWFQE